MDRACTDRGRDPGLDHAVAAAAVVASFADLSLAADVGAVDPAPHHRSCARRRHTVAGLLARRDGRQPCRFRDGAGIHRLILGRLLLFAWTVALFYHLVNGIRHLFWDAGRGFELRSVYASGWAVVIAAVALSLITWLAGYASRGGAM